MNQQKVLDDFSKLPPEAQRQVVDFMAFLKTRYQTAPHGSKKRASSIQGMKFIGMWKDREDLQDSSAWVRNLRQKEWEN